MFKTLKDINTENKKVLVRCDFNVPLSKAGKVEDDFRIKKTIPTIKELLKNNAKIILMSHLGDPEGEFKKELSLEPVRAKLEELLGVSIIKTDSCIGEKTKRIMGEMKPGEIILLENLRFEKGEENNDEVFVKELAALGEVFINDAFGCCHRAHASIVGIPRFLPSCAGLLLEKEISVLSKVMDNPWRPFVAIIGGVKISTKIKLIKKLLEKADHLLLGGEIANAILRAKNIVVGKPLPDEEKIVKEIESIELTSPKLHLPVDVIASPNRRGDIYTRRSAIGTVRKEEFLPDIGPETIEVFSKIIESAGTIVWSGPLSLFEEPIFEKGTKEIAEAIVKNHKAYKVIGGGETLFAADKFGLTEKFDHVSTGGGAMLNFLAGEKLPGIKALEENEK
jgi:phosphoglycerate kinase